MAENSHTSEIVEKEGASDAMHQEHKEGVKVETVQGSLALDIARRKNPPKPWSVQMRKLYLFLTVAYLCSAVNGTRETLEG